MDPQILKRPSPSTMAVSEASTALPDSRCAPASLCRHDSVPLAAAARPQLPALCPAMATALSPATSAVPGLCCLPHLESLSSIVPV